MSDESTAEPQPAHEEPPGDEATTDAPDAGSALPRGFLAHFARATIPGTELTIRAPSARQASDNYKDAANDELDDREFTVRLVQRQLDQETPIEDVRSWTDDQLLDAADAYLSLDTGYGDEQAVEEGAQEPVEGEPDEGDADDVDAEPEPLTFAAVRDDIRQQGVIRGRRLKEMITGISSLTSGAMTPSLAAAMKGLDMAAYKSAIAPLAGVDLSRIAGPFAGNALAGIDLKALAGTSAMGDSIKKMMGDIEKAQKSVVPMSSLPELRAWTPEVYAPIRVTPVVRPEIGLLQGVNESLEKIHDDQVRLAEDQIAVMTQQGQLIKNQGEALVALVNDAKGQKWSRRALLWLTVVIAVTGIVLAFLAGGLIRPFGAGPEATSAPVVTTSPVPAPPSAATAP